MDENQQTRSSGPAFLRIPLWRLVVLSIVTCKLYEVYWFYKNWQCVKERDGVSISPLWRALLGIFYIHRLLGRVYNDKEADDLQKPTFSSGTMATIWIVLVIVQIIVSRIPGSTAVFIAVLMPTYLCLVPAQRFINDVEEKRNAGQPDYPWSRGHIILIAVGIIYWGFFFAAVIPKMAILLNEFDRTGGVILVLRVDAAGYTDDERSDAIEETVGVLKERIKSLGTVSANVERYGLNDIRVKLPGVYDEPATEAIKSLLSVSPLSLHVVVDDAGLYQKALDEGATEHYVFKTIAGEPNETVLIEKESVMDGRTLKNASVIVDEFGRPSISVTFKDKGGDLFAKITRENINRRLAILINGKVLSAPLIRETVPGGNVLISGSFTHEEASSFAASLRAGALPASVDIVMEEVVTVAFN